MSEKRFNTHILKSKKKVIFYFYLPFSTWIDGNLLDKPSFHPSPAGLPLLASHSLPGLMEIYWISLHFIPLLQGCHCWPLILYLD
jgi:hypothetical protein